MSQLKNISLAVLLLLISHISLAAEARYALGVDGLACPYCAYSLEKQFKQIEGVEDIEIDLKHSRAVVTMLKDRSLSKVQAQQAVEDAGFALKSFSIIPSASENGDA